MYKVYSLGKFGDIFRTSFNVFYRSIERLNCDFSITMRSVTKKYWVRISVYAISSVGKGYYQIQIIIMN